MTWRALTASAAVHAGALAALWLGCLTGQPGPVIDQPPGPIVFVPAKGSPPSRVHRKGPGHGRREPPGSSVDLAGVTLTIDDGAAGGMIDALKKWQGRVTDCTPDPTSMIRFWVYQPDLWPETASMDGIPCADFPIAFGEELARRVEASAGQGGLRGPVRRVIIGFFPGDPGGFRIVKIG